MINDAEKATPTQSERSIDTARAIGYDEDEAAFNTRLKS